MPAQFRRPMSLPIETALATTAWPSASLATSHFDEGAANIACHGLAPVLLHVGNHHQPAGGGQHARRAFAQAGCAARDDEYLALDFHSWSPVNNVDVNVNYDVVAIHRMKKPAGPGSVKALPWSGSAETDAIEHLLHFGGVGAHGPDGNGLALKGLLSVAAFSAGLSSSTPFGCGHSLLPLAK